MMNIQGIVGWACPVCKRKCASVRRVCNCGASHRPTEFWAREISELRRENRALRACIIISVAVFALAAWSIALFST